MGKCREGAYYLFLLFGLLLMKSVEDSFSLLLLDWNIVFT